MRLKREGKKKKKNRNRARLCSFECTSQNTHASLCAWPAINPPLRRALPSWPVIWGTGVIPPQLAVITREIITRPACFPQMLSGPASRDQAEAKGRRRSFAGFPVPGSLPASQASSKSLPRRSPRRESAPPGSRVSAPVPQIVLCFLSL